METSALGQATVLGHAMADVAAAREGARQKRLRRVLVILTLVVVSIGLRLRRLAHERRPVPGAGGGASGEETAPR